MLRLLIQQLLVYLKYKEKDCNMENLIKINNTISWRNIENAEIIDVQKLDELALHLTLAECGTYYFDYPNTSVNDINYKTIDELINALK